jgi:L-threonylcarbamoyladenylate synthase
MQAVDVLRKGGTVAFPTETVYGLGADASNADAVKKVFIAKGRPSDNPLIVHIASLKNCANYAEIVPDKGITLAKKFWPGPLTLILKKKKGVPDIVTAKLDTVALRVPAHPIALKLLEIFGGGIVGPSANISGRPSPTSAEHVYNDLNGKIDVIIDAGSTAVGIESTVLDLTVDPPAVLRYGGISPEDIEAEIGFIAGCSDIEHLKKSPGTHHRHYSPGAKVILFPKGDEERLFALLDESRSRGEICGAITHSEFQKIDLEPEFHIAIQPTVEYIARNIFRALRELDDKNVDSIFVESVEEKGLGKAVMDRLARAASR